MEPVALLVGAVFVAVGGIVAQNARSTFGRYRRLSTLVDAPEDGTDQDGTTVVDGRVRVETPAEPDRTPPDDVEWPTKPALWAWRVRRKVNAGGEYSRTEWKTVDGGLALGEFTVVEDGWDGVRVLADDVADDGIDDPFESDTLYLGDPDVSMYLGDLDPINRFLERTGLAGPDGVVSDVEVSISVGRQTSMPDRYEASIIGAGDDLLVSGEVKEVGEAGETDEERTIHQTDDTPLVFASGELAQQAKNIRSSALKTGVASALFGFAGVAVIALGVL